MKDRGFLSPVTENFLHAYGVGKVAMELAERFGLDPETAFIAGSLHDLGGAVPNDDRAVVAEALGIELAEEEYQVPMLIHAKLGDYFAQALFGIEDPDILDAILYHTTGIDGAVPLVQIVFLADKIHWDRNGEPPYLTGLQEALTVSLDEGCRYFLDWLWHSDLYVIHPFLKRSYGGYIQGQHFPKIIREKRPAILGNEIKEKYFLNEITAEFQQVFQMGHEAAEQMGQGQKENNLAYLAAVLSNSVNTIFDNQRITAAEAAGIQTEGKSADSLLPELAYYFAKEEFGVTDPELLHAILFHQEEHLCKNACCQAVSAAFRLQQESAATNF